MEFSDDFEESEAATSSPRASSEGPNIPTPTKQEVRYILDPTQDIYESEDEEDANYLLQTKRASPLTANQKVSGTLDHLKMYSRFSVHDFLSGLFTSDAAHIKKSAGMFYAESSHLKLMDLWWEECGGVRNEQLVDWVIGKAAEVVARESSFVTTRASAGPFLEDAQGLRLPAEKMAVDVLRKFRMKNLLSTYERVSPQFQKILHAFITPSDNESGRDRNPVSYFENTT